MTGQESPNSMESARAVHDAGVAHARVGRYAAALASFDEALPLYRLHAVPAELAACLMNRANCLPDLGRPEAALAAYDEALPLFRQHARPADLASCLMNRANCLQDLGRGEAALAAYDEAVPLHRLHALPANLARCLMNRASCLQRLGQREAALAAYDEALPLFHQHALPANLARCLMNQAVCLQELGRGEGALAAYDEALPLARQHSLPAELARCVMNRANCLGGLGRREEALAAYDEAVPLFRRHALPADLASCLVNRAVCLQGLGQPEAALTAYDEAAPLFRQHSLPADLARCLMNRAACLQDLGRTEQALAAYDEAFAADDRASTLLQELPNRTRAREQTADRYRFATQLALDLEQPERAWGYVQRGKGRTLTDLLAARADLTALDRQELLLVQQRDAGLVDQDTYAAAMTRLGDQRQAQQTARLGRDQRAPVSLAEVATALQPGEVLLDTFTVGGDRLLCLFLLGPGQAAVAWVGAVDGEALTTLADRWAAARSQWRDASSAKVTILTSHDAAFIARRDTLLAQGDYDATMKVAAADEAYLLAELGALVFAPVLAQLDETVTTLIVSPDGVLHRLPLAAVTVADAVGRQIPLIDRIDLQLVPTASSLAILRGPHGPRLTWPAALLAAAPFALDEVDEPGDAATPAGDRADVGAYAPRDLLREGDPHDRLKYSGPEIRAVADRLRTAGCPEPTLYTREATRTQLEETLPVAHMLHLATHGGALEADETVMDYRIFLAGDSELRVRELYEGEVTLKDVFLVNLSACSLGEVVLQGAEASGFVQAFLQAGTGVVLAPVWAVDDRATKELMVRFYEEMTAADAPTVAQAWRRATQRLRRETGYTHPIYWAGFLPSGDASLRLTT